MIEIYDANGQPYNADLVPGSEYRKLVAALRELGDLSRDRRQCRITLRNAIAKAPARAESATPECRCPVCGEPTPAHKKWCNSILSATPKGGAGE